MLKAFQEFLSAHKLLPAQGPTLLAVSGGVDSVVMCNLFKLAKLDFAVAHCNFGLRSGAAACDEAWVRDLAQRYAVPFFSRSFEVATYAQQQGVSIQMAARALRYAWFETLCEEQGWERVATAHHSNDCLETVLLHLTKGTGIAGLHGILPRQGRYIRPLLFADKAAIRQYAQQRGLSWREDCSNAKDDYQRNLIRNQVIPLLKKINPNLEATFRLTVERLGQVEALFNERALFPLRQALFRQRGTDYSIAVQDIQAQPWAPVVLWEWLKPFGFSFVQLRALLAQPRASGTMLRSVSHCLYVDRGQWIVTPRAATGKAAFYTIEAGTTALELPYCTLHCAQIPLAQHTLVPDRAVAALDWAQLQFPLTVRLWQPGDVFFPLGMQHRKKLSDFLIDQKVPRPYKAQVWVVTSGGKIVWVVGHRIDDRFKLTAATQQAYVIKKVPVLAVT